MLSIRPYRSEDWQEIAAIHDGARLIALYLSEGFDVAETKAGRPAGNDRFTATGHRLVRAKPS